MTQLSEYEKEQLAAIEVWKNEEPGFVSQALGVAIAPLAWLLEKAVPEAAVRVAIDAASQLGLMMTDTADVLRSARVSELGALRDKDLGLCDELANDVHDWAVGVAVVEGAATGAFGILGAPLDIPAVITLSMRTIHKIGVCYGYECKTPDDQQFARKILLASGASTLEEKLAALAALTTARAILVRQTWKAMAEKLARSQFGREAAVVTVPSLARQVGLILVKRRALAAIPIIGATVGGSVNGCYINAVGWAARRTFQERWLADAGKLTPDDDVN